VIFGQAKNYNFLVAGVQDLNLRSQHNCAGHMTYELILLYKYDFFIQYKCVYLKGSPLIFSYNFFLELNTRVWSATACLDHPSLLLAILFLQKQRFRISLKLKCHRNFVRILNMQML
jgi:hypothetical protein